MKQQRKKSVTCTVYTHSIHTQHIVHTYSILEGVYYDLWWRKSTWVEQTGNKCPFNKLKSAIWYIAIEGMVHQPFGLLPMNKRSSDFILSYIYMWRIKKDEEEVDDYDENWVYDSVKKVSDSIHCCATLLNSRSILDARVCVCHWGSFSTQNITQSSIFTGASSKLQTFITNRHALFLLAGRERFNTILFERVWKKRTQNCLCKLGFSFIIVPKLVWD